MNAVAYFHRDVEDNRHIFLDMMSGFVRGMDATASVGLRNKISATCSSLNARSEMYAAWGQSGSAFAEMVRNCPVEKGEFLDPDLNLEDASRGALSRILRDRKRLRIAQASVLKDTRFKAEDCRTLTEAFRACIAQNIVAEQALEALVAAINFHDEAAVADDERDLQSTAQILQFVYGERAGRKEAAYTKLCTSEEFSYDAVKRSFKCHLPEQSE